MTCPPTQPTPKRIGSDCQRDGCPRTVADGPLWRVNPKGERGIFMCEEHMREAEL